MKKLLFGAVILCACLRSIYATNMVGAQIFSPDTQQVSVSTNCASPTQIMIKDSFISHTFVVNNSSWTNLLISSTSASITTTSNFFVPASSSFSPDGPTDAYNGAVWACSTPTVSGVQAASVAKVSVFRSK